MENNQFLLVIGGSGNLGRGIINSLKGNYKTINISFTQNQQSYSNIILQKENYSSPEHLQKIKENINQITQNNKVYSIICVAGAWDGTSIGNENILQVYERMNFTSTLPSILACHLASHFLIDNGTLLFTSATSSIQQNIDLNNICYLLAKNSVNLLAKNMANLNRYKVYTLLPSILDTPENRQCMPNSDFTKWAKVDQISDLIRKWLEGENQPKNGDFIILNVVDEQLKIEIQQ